MPNPKRRFSKTRTASRRSTKKAAVPTVSIDPNSVVRGLSRLFRQVLRNHAELSLELDETLGSIHADSGHLEQVLLNLVVNARDAVDGLGKVVLRTKRRNVLAEADLAPGTYVALEVSDNGSGMSDAVRAHMFEPFFTTKVHGFGLGLATVQTLVQQNGGQISVTSVPGQGTTFCLMFPELAGPGHALLS